MTVQGAGQPFRFAVLRDARAPARRLWAWHPPCSGVSSSPCQSSTMKSVFLAGFLLLAGAIVAPGATAAQISDSDLAERVAEAVRRYPKFSVFDDVNVSVNNRVVTLTGRVTTPQKKDELGDRTGKVDGVRSLVNDIGVL